MKNLIIAEKPSLAAKIVSALKSEDNFTRKDGYFESENYIVTFAFGHLFVLDSVEDYVGTTEKGKWNKDISLPFIPDRFNFSLKDDDGVRKQFDIIKKLALSEEVGIITNCGDADREGEIIIRIILDNIGANKPVKRLWLPEQSEDTILKAVHDLKDSEYYENLAQEGYTRIYIDWLFGINLTRHMTYKTGKLLPTGRVIIPIVKFIYDRDKEIKNFVESEYINLESKETTNGEVIPLKVKDKFLKDDKGAIDTIAKKLNTSDCVVTDIKSISVKKQPSKLFSLSKLQGYLSKKHKMTLEQSLAAVQKLYENGYITYPRTNTEYLAENEKSKIEDIIGVLRGKGYNLKLIDTKRIFDDSKIESHSALTPTMIIPNENTLVGNENIVYETILNRFICNFLDEETIINKQIINIECDEYTFQIEGSSVVNEGFFKYEAKSDSNEKVLPNLNIGDKVQINFVPIIKKTKPPGKLNVEELLSCLKHPFKKDGDSDDEEYKKLLAGIEIGTEATRTSIIENAKKNGYIVEKDTVYSITTLGEYFIDTLIKLKVNLFKEKTIELSKQLKQVYKNELTYEDVITQVALILNDTISISSDISVDSFNEDKEVIGKCPVCKKDIYENKKSYFCSGYKDGCKFSLWKDNKFFQKLGKEMTKSNAKSLLTNGKCLLKNCTSAKGGKYDTNVLIKIKDGFAQFELKFINNNK